MLVFGISNSAQLIHKPSSNDKESGIQYLKSGIRHSLEQNARLSWMTLHRTTQSKGIRIPESEKILLMESAIQGFGIRITAY